MTMANFSPRGGGCHLLASPKHATALTPPSSLLVNLEHFICVLFLEEFSLAVGICKRLRGVVFWSTIRHDTLNAWYKGLNMIPYKASKSQSTHCYHPLAI